MAFGCMIVNVNFIKLYVSWTWRWRNNFMDLGGATGNAYGNS